MSRGSPWLPGIHTPDPAPALVPTAEPAQAANPAPPHASVTFVEHPPPAPPAPAAAVVTASPTADPAPPPASVQLAVHPPPAPPAPAAAGGGASPFTTAVDEFHELTLQGADLLAYEPMNLPQHLNLDAADAPAQEVSMPDAADIAMEAALLGIAEHDSNETLQQFQDSDLLQYQDEDAPELGRGTRQPRDKPDPGRGAKSPRIV